MWWKLIFVQAMIFGIVFLVCKATVQLIGKWFIAKNYKIKKEFYYMLIFIITITIGVFLGGEILYRIL